MVEILSTEECISRRRQDFENTIVDLQDRYIESTTAKVVDRDFFRFAFSKTVGQSSGSGLIDDPFYLEPRDLARVACCLALHIVEIGRDCNDGFRDLIAQKFLGSGL